MLTEKNIGEQEAAAPGNPGQCFLRRDTEAQGARHPQQARPSFCSCCCNKQKFNHYYMAEPCYHRSIYVNLQARDSGEQRYAGVSDPQAEALPTPAPRIGFHRSLYTPYILAYIFAKDSV